VPQTSSIQVTLGRSHGGQLQETAYDVTLLINGLPLIQVGAERPLAMELKATAFFQPGQKNRYQRHSIG